MSFISSQNHNAISLSKIEMLSALDIMHRSNMESAHFITFNGAHLQIYITTEYSDCETIFDCDLEFIQCF